MTVPKRFGVLRFIGALLKVLAWIILIVSVLGGVGAAGAERKGLAAKLLEGALGLLEDPHHEGGLLGRRDVLGLRGVLGEEPDGHFVAGQERDDGRETLSRST